MAKKNKLGNKYTCYQCGCKFYDLNQPTPLCPQCGTDQSKTPPKSLSAVGQTADSLRPPVKRTRSSRKKRDEEDLDENTFFAEGNADDDLPEGKDLTELEDGLSVIDDDDLIDSDTDDLLEDEA